MGFKRQLLHVPNLEALYLPKRGFFIYDPITLNPHSPDNETPSCIWFDEEGFHLSCIGQSCPVEKKSQINVVYHNEIYPCIATVQEASEWFIVNGMLDPGVKILETLTSTIKTKLGVGRWMYFGQVPFYVSPKKIKVGTTETLSELNEAQQMFFANQVKHVNIIYIGEASKNLYRSHINNNKSFCFDASEFITKSKQKESIISQEFNITKPSFKFSTRFLRNRSGNINVKYNNVLYAIDKNLTTAQFWDHKVMKEKWPGYQRFKI